MPPPTIRVHLTAPLDLAASLEPYRRWGDDLLDRWDGTRLLRTVRVGGDVVAYRAEIAGGVDMPALAVTPDRPVDRDALTAAVRASFVAAPPSWPSFLACDPVIAALDVRYRGLRPVLQPDLFTALIRSISAQQVNLQWAATTRRRLAEAFGERHEIAGETLYSLPAERVATASVDQIRALQFTTMKARSIVAVATAFATGAIDAGALALETDEDVIARLVELRGIGRWSAEWILARTFGRPVVVAGDLGVRKAVAQLYLGLPIASEAVVREATVHWGNAATVAQTLALRSLVG